MHCSVGPLIFFFAPSSEATSHVPGSDVSTWMRQLEIPSFLLTTTMPPIACTEMVTSVLDKMRSEDQEDDRLQNRSGSLCSWPYHDKVV